MVDGAMTAEAIALRGSEILAVGTRVEIEALRDDTTKMIDLGGRTLLPGFFDPHGHMFIVGIQALSANLLPAPDGTGNSISALQEILRGWMLTNKAILDRYKIVLGFGYDDSQLAEQRHPTREELDAVTTEYPVLLIHQSSHLGAANSKALEIAGVTAQTPDPMGGAYRRQNGSREPNGVLEETAFLATVGALTSGFDQNAMEALVHAGAGYYAKFGYTTAQEARAFGPVASQIISAAEKRALPIDVLIFPDIITSAASISGRYLSRDYQHRVRIGGAKLSLDGSPQGKTAWLTKPYLVPPEGKNADYRGYPAMEEPDAAAAVEQAFRNGWQLQCHCNGDAAADEFISIVRAATERHGPADRRVVLIHGQTLRADQLDAMKLLGIIPSLFPMHTFYWGDWHRDSVLGEDRARNISPTGWVIDRGMRFTSHHDAPVANPDAMRVLSATVTRKTRTGEVLGPDQRVSAEIGLKAMTIWAAWQHFEEHRKGSLEPGKQADLVILSDNPLTVDPDRIAEIKVVETIKGGVSVYAA